MEQTWAEWLQLEPPDPEQQRFEDICRREEAGELDE